MLLHITIILLATVLMGAGLFGSILPFLPGSPLILLGAFIYAWHTDFTIITWATLLLLLVLTLLSQVLDFLSSMIGAKKFGASRWGVIGAFLGGVGGLFLGGILGMIIAPFLGAFFLELIHGRDINTSLKISWGTFIGFLAGTMGKLVIAITMIGVFLINLI